MLYINKDSRICEGYFPDKGMLGTQRVGSDRYIVICTEVLSKTRISIATLYDIDEDNIKKCPYIYKGENGAMYLDLENTKNDIVFYKPEQWSLRKDGIWRKMNSTWTGTIQWGVADPHLDPNF